MPIGPPQHVYYNPTLGQTQDPRRTHCHHVIVRLVCNRNPSSSGPRHWPENFPYTKRDVHKCFDIEWCPYRKDENGFCRQQAGVTADKDYDKAEDIVYWDRRNKECSKCETEKEKHRVLEAKSRKERRDRDRDDPERREERTKRAKFADDRPRDAEGRFLNS